MALFILNFDKIFAFQAVASGYAVFISRNNTKVVNDTPNGIKNRYAFTVKVSQFSLLCTLVIF